MLLATGLSVRPAFAQEFPVRPVKIVVSSTTHGALRDLPALLAGSMEAAWRQVVQVDSLLAGQRLDPIPSVISARPDGHTILFASIDQILLTPSLQPRLAYNPRQDLLPVAVVSRSPLLLVTRTQAPFKDVDDLARALRANPLDSFASNRDSVSQLLVEWITRRTSIRLGNTAYRTDHLAAMSVAGGITSAAVLDWFSVGERLTKGELKILRILSEDRADLESARKARDLPSVGILYWTGLFVPAGTPSSTIVEINHQVSIAMTREGVKRKFEGTDTVFGGATPAEFGRLIERDEPWVRWLVTESRGKAD